jgi:UDP-N-acetylglucosamine--N-acetylmuramyl-(pentapeptide) pyrophosphoryl-undecaprenol N-acetylglucosamine transferase
MAYTRHNIRILLVGGGSGGHFFPLISIAEALNRSMEKPALYYAGPDRYDAEALQKEGITFIHIPAGKRRRYSSIRNFFDIFKTIYGTFVALIKLYILYPDVIMSKGGYTSVPVILAATFYRIPIVIHESDAVIGTANRLGARFAKTVIVNYSETQKLRPHKDVINLGIPVRSALLQNSAGGLSARLGMDTDKPLILVLGGSQGAERINQLILDSLDELLKDFAIVHQTGPSNFEITQLSAERLITNPDEKNRYRAVAFLNAAELNDGYAEAKLVISRAGSTSIYEIALHAKPSIIIPIPEEISHDQKTNAYEYARNGAATVMEEHNLLASLLRAEIDRIMQNEELYKSMADAARSFAKTDSASQIASLLIARAKTH